MVVEPATTSGLLTADGVIYARPCVLVGFQINPAAADTTLVLYDNATAASGTVVAKMLVKASTTGVYVSLQQGVGCANGLYADITGASAEFIVNFTPLR